MTVNYTTNLGLGLPVTGTESGLWGDIVNNQITSLVETAISGTTSVAVTTVDVTLTATQGAANQARSMVITLTGASTAARNVICPAVSKIYIVRNNTTGGFAHTFKTSAGSGISVPNGREMLLYCDGTNVLEGIDNFNTLAQNGNLISLAGSLTTSGANALTLTTTGSTNVTLPTTGTLATTSQVGPQGGGSAVITTTGSTQTFTIPTGVTRLKVTVVGGGGNGGAYTALVGCTPAASGSGGGGGGAAIVWLTGLTPGNTISVTVGTAGNTSSIFNGTQTITTVSATGGAAGNSGGGGGAGGLGSAGSLNIRGGYGGGGSTYTTNQIGGGVGGSSIVGGGGQAAVGGAYGGGGSGGTSGGGFAGASGVVFFEY